MIAKTGSNWYPKPNDVAAYAETCIDYLLHSHSFDPRQLDELADRWIKLSAPGVVSQWLIDSYGNPSMELQQEFRFDRDDPEWISTWQVMVEWTWRSFIGSYLPIAKEYTEYALLQPQLRQLGLQSVYFPVLWSTIAKWFNTNGELAEVDEIKLRQCLSALPDKSRHKILKLYPASESAFGKFIHDFYYSL